VIIGTTNTGSASTVVSCSGAVPAVSGITSHGQGYGVRGEATASQGIGLHGIASSVAGGFPSIGCLAESQSLNGLGIRAMAPRGGVEGYASRSDGIGTLGMNSYTGSQGRGIGLYGQVNAGVTSIAVYGLNYSPHDGPTPGAGGFGVYGLSQKGHGLVGATASAGAAAVVGATNGVAGAYAATFYGPAVVSGDFTVVGGAKSAAVPHPDGSHRRLYCVESPESWFEDFGSAKLVCGDADVALDPDFAAVVDTSDYHVFLTGYDGLSDLSVCDRTSEGFRVRATRGAGDGTFSWRVVAKRKDIAAPRFETVETPKEPALPPVPDSVYQEAPAPPDIHRAMATASPRPKRKA
jgi:hypothetical protein